MTNLIPGVPTSTKKYVSVSVTPTRLTGGGAEKVSYKYKGANATHWSLYLRTADGSMLWQQDIEIDRGRSASSYFGDAMVAASRLSMEFQIPIEQLT